jgi:hypothetical protein
MVQKYPENVFGTTFVPKKKNIDCVIGYFTRRKIVDEKTGLFRQDSLKKITKSMIWFFLLYLWIHNHDEINQSFFGNIKTKEYFLTNVKRILYQYYIENIKTKNKSNENETDNSFRITKSQLFDFSIYLIGAMFSNIEDLKIPFLENVQNIELLKQRNTKIDSRLRVQSEKIDDILNEMEYNIKNPKLKKIMTTNKDNEIIYKNLFTNVKLYHE